MSNVEALVTQISLVCIMVFNAATIGYMVSNDRLVFRLVDRIIKLEQRVKELERDQQRDDLSGVL